MKILFFIYHPGFVRHFTQPLRELCDEGHTVHLAFHNEKMEAERWTRELREGHDKVTYSVKAPRRNDEWANTCFRLRAMLDYAMYFHPWYEGAERIRAGAARELSDEDRATVERIVAKPGMRWFYEKYLYLAERSIPSDPEIEKFITGHEPDIVLVTPLVAFNSPQVDVIKSARHLGIPTALWVASWDNLTNKGRMRELPDRVIVWNGAQQKEATELHGMPKRRVMVSGAQSFDHWFEFKPNSDAATFLSERGLNPNSKLILYLCSSTSIAPDEVEFIREWHAAVRGASDPAVANAAILIRPHPMNKQPWEKLDGLPNVCVWPRHYLGAFEPDTRSEYFDSLFHASAVVGLNTSGQVEAGIVGRPVLTLLSEKIPRTLYGTTDTLHFKHLLGFNGGLLHVADSFDRHVSDLSRALAGDPAMIERSRRFTEAFIRPNGLDRPASPIVADMVRSLASVVPKRRGWEQSLVEPFILPMLKRM